ncbi:unnamed protein product [Rhizopus stolonifer]
MTLIRSSTVFVSLSLFFLPVLILFVVLCLPLIMFITACLYLSAWITCYLEDQFNLPYHPTKVIKINLTLAGQIWNWVRSLPTLASCLYWRYNLHEKRFEEIVSVDIQYNSTGYLDVYHPEREEKAPILIFVYGDEWFPKHKFLYRVFSNSLRELGYVVVVPDQKYPNDTRDLIQWVYKHAKEINGDPDMIYIMGHGSGARRIAQVVLADVIEKAKYHHALSHVDGKHDATQPSDFLPQVRGLLLFSGTYDSSIQMIEENGELFADSLVVLDLWPRIMLLHGQRDKIMPVDQSSKMFNALGHVLPTERRDEVDVRMRLYKRMNHREPVTALMPALFKSSLQTSLKRDIQGFINIPSFQEKTL